MSERNRNLRNPNIVSLTHGFDFLKDGKTAVSLKDLSLPVSTVRKDPPKSEPLSQKPKSVPTIIAQPSKKISPRSATIPQRSGLLARNRIADMKDTEVEVSEGGLDAILRLMDSGKKPVPEIPAAKPFVKHEIIPPPVVAQVVTPKLPATELNSLDEATRSGSFSDIVESLKNLKTLCSVAGNEIFLRALFIAVDAFTQSISEQLDTETPKTVNKADDLEYSITIKKLSGRHSYVKFGYHEFYMHPSHAEVFKLLVLAKGEIVELETIQKMFKMKHLHNARHIMAKVIKSLEISVPKLNGCIRNRRGNGYYIVPPSE